MRLYEDIEITVIPYSGWRYKWKATAFVQRPYNGWGGSDEFIRLGKTAEEATKKLKDKLCKITAKEEEKNRAYHERTAGIKRTTFNRDKDCNPVVPRPPPFTPPGKYSIG